MLQFLCKPFVLWWNWFKQPTALDRVRVAETMDRIFPPEGCCPRCGREEDE